MERVARGGGRFDGVGQPERQKCTGDGHHDVHEQQPLRLDIDHEGQPGRQRTERAGQRRRRVVGAEEARRIAPPAALGSIACSRDVNGPDSTTSVETVPVRAARTRSHVSSVRANAAPATPMTTKSAVPAAAPEAIARPCDRERGERHAGEERSEHDPDLEPGEAPPGERDADENAPEPVGERPERLDGEDAASVAGQAVSDSTSFRHHA